GRRRVPRRPARRRGGAGGGARGDVADLLARGRDLQGRRQGRVRQAQAGREAAFLAPFDVRLLPGVGPRAEERLRTAGIATIGALAALDDAQLRRLLPGKVGSLLRDRARGIDPRGLETQVERISISTEETFERDIADRAQLRA